MNRRVSRLRLAAMAASAQVVLSLSLLALLRLGFHWSSPYSVVTAVVVSGVTLILLSAWRQSRDEANRQRVRASPAARRLAYRERVDLSQVRGTGPDGRIIEQDVMWHVIGQEPLTDSSKGAA